MNILELEELLTKKGIKVSNRLIAEIIEMDEASYCRKKKLGSELKQKSIEKIEEKFCLSLSLNNIINSDCIDIDYYENVYGSCGFGVKVFEESTSKLAIPKSMIENYSSGHKYSVINSRGDSMLPFIQDNDKLIVEHWEGSQIIDNRIYVFSYDNEIFIKRLIKNITQIVIKSDNPSYKQIEIDGKDEKFNIIGQIVGLLRDVR